jgi:hypothetical protein
MYPRFFKSSSSEDSFYYSQISEVTESTHTRLPIVSVKRHASLWLRFALLTLCSILFTGFAIYGIYVYFNGAPPMPVTCYCGTTIAEARTLGCKFDSLSVSWLPKHCRDDELTAEFDRSGPGPNGEWSYWADLNATQPITVEEASMLAGNPPSRAAFYSTYGWHVAHCAFFWRKEFRQRAKGLMFEKRHDKESHIQHCYTWFMKELPLNSTGTIAFVSLGGEGFAPKHKEEDHVHHHSNN